MERLNGVQKNRKKDVYSPTRTIHSTIRRVGLEGRITSEGEAA